MADTPGQDRGIIVRCAVLLVAASLAACSGAPPEDDVLAAASSIRADELLQTVSRLASDEFEGRGPGTRGDRLAREYLAGRLEQLGFQPAFEDGAWFQPFKIVGVDSKMPPE